MGWQSIVAEVLDDFDNLAVPNSDPDALLAQVIADFEAAFAGLPTKAEWGDAKLGRATKWAAKAYAGKAYVWKKSGLMQYQPLMKFRLLVLLC